MLKMDLSKWPSAPRGANHIELSTENLGALFEQLEAQGLTNFTTSCMLSCNEGIEQFGKVAL